MNFVRLKLPLMLRLGILFLSPAGISLGQQTAPSPSPPYDVPLPPGFEKGGADYGEKGNLAAYRLRRQQKREFVFDRASLRDVLRFLADAAGIPFMSIKEADQANHQLVTFTMNASPFVALESVCLSFGIRLTYEDGVWFMMSELSRRKEIIEQANQRIIREEKSNELFGKIYRLNYDPVDRVDFKGDGVSSSSQSSGAQGQSSGTSTTSLSLQNSQRVFHPTVPRLVNEIRTMLGLGPLTFDQNGIVIGEEINRGETSRATAPDSGIIQNTKGQVNYTPGSTTITHSKYADYETSVSSKADEKPSEVVPVPPPLNPIYIPAQMPQVIYNTDNNTLWIVATKQQHEWVAEYLQSVDVPQDLIAIEVKFFETTRDPSKELGINWSGTMAGGYTVALRNIKATPQGSIDYMTGKSYGASSGTAGTLPNIKSGGPVISGGSVDPGKGANLDGWAATKGASLTAGAPYSAILTAGDMAVTLQAFMSDEKTSMVQYPRVLTVNNREVAISSAINTPILSSSQTTGQGGSSTSTSQVNYLPIGTQINILPKTVGKEDIAMTVALTISSYVSDKIIAGNTYPITASRIYNAALQVKQGYTLAVGGLESTDDTRKNNGIPFLQDLPGVGEFFKSKTRTRNKKNLIVFITPTRIENPKATRGISETPESVIPIRPNDPPPPAFTPDGQLVGGRDAIPAAFAWFDFQIKWFKQINNENRTDKESIKQLRAVISSVRMLVRNIAAMQENADPIFAQEMSKHEQRAIATLTELNRILAYAQNNVM